jgi:uncharacterized protein
MGNPFYLQEVPIDAPFCNRLEEMKDLRSYAEAKAHVVLYSPRRYGKTSLVKRVQSRLDDKGMVCIFADFFGVDSVDDVASRLAKAVFAVTHRKAPLWKKALRAVRSFQPVLKPDVDGGFSLTVEPAAAGKRGLALLEETMDSLGEFIHTSGTLVHIALDEFQEITVLREALQIEAVMRTHIQGQKASYFFIGSRRRILLEIFNGRQRPFFQSAINYPLKPLPAGELAPFIAAQFRKNKRKCSETLAQKLGSMVDFHPYYSQKLAFFVFEISNKVNEETIDEGFEKLVASEKPVFEAIIQSRPPHQRLLLKAFGNEPTQKPLAGSYLHRHGLVSIGGVQHSLRQLEELDLIEKDTMTGVWRHVDPVFAFWLKSRTAERV